MRICEYVENRKEILGGSKMDEGKQKQKIEVIECKMGFRVYMRLQFEICFVGWLWGIKECNGCASLENMKNKRMVILM